MSLKKEASNALKSMNLDLTKLDGFIDGTEDMVEYHLDDNNEWYKKEIRLSKKDREFAKKIQDQLQDLLDM